MVNGVTGQIKEFHHLLMNITDEFKNKIGNPNVRVKIKVKIVIEEVIVH
jgi:hypothetical protein